MQADNNQMVAFFSELDALGTLGYSLWHLKAYLDAPGLKYELKTLAQQSGGHNEDTLIFRSQGFLLLAAAHLAKQGFHLEFIPRRKNVQTPDFFALRDGNKFACEVTTLQPKSGDFASLEFFWTKINGKVDLKKSQLKQPEYGSGVLIIDCTSVWEALGLGQVPIGAQLAYSIPTEHGGFRSGSTPLVRLDDSVHTQGLRDLQEIVRGTGIHTLVLWKYRLEILEERYKRHLAYCVIGTMDGIPFWSYFDKALVFPGPNVSVNWT